MRFIRNILKNTVLISLSLVLIAPIAEKQSFAQSSAQTEADRAREERNKRDGQRTKKSQAVSKSVYEKITRAQEIMEAGDNEGALKILTALRASVTFIDPKRRNTGARIRKLLSSFPRMPTYMISRSRRTLLLQTLLPPELSFG